MSWIRNIARNRELVDSSSQPRLAVIVSGSAADRDFWRSETERTKRDTLRADGALDIVSLAEDTPAGNFLGTLRAWMQLTSAPTTGVSVMSMVFGQGKRYSPFTQALGNRKAAFPTPLRGARSGGYLRTGDIALLYSSQLLSHLANSGFEGVVVKWGDEAIIPSLEWSPSSVLGDVDIVRFVWKTRPTEVLAREKEWWVLNESTGLIERLIPRQSFETLQSALQSYQGDRYSTAVNLGSIGMSYRFLEIACRVFGELALSPNAAADWDPIVNLLLLLGDGEDPYDDPATASGLRAAESRCPGLAPKIRELRAAINHALGRPVHAAYVEYGDALWIDLGLHTTLQKTLEALIEDNEYGRALRAFFGIPEERDENGNIIVDSAVEPTRSQNSTVSWRRSASRSVRERAMAVRVASG